MKFNPGDVVRIVAPVNIDYDEKPVYREWENYQATVMRPEITENMLFGGKAYTKLEPIEDRPDSYEGALDPRRFFYWETDELELVSRVEEDNEN